MSKLVIKKIDRFKVYKSLKAIYEKYVEYIDNGNEFYEVHNMVDVTFINTRYIQGGYRGFCGNLRVCTDNYGTLIVDFPELMKHKPERLINDYWYDFNDPLQHHKRLAIINTILKEEQDAKDRRRKERSKA